MRTRARVDINQKEITKALRMFGASVQPLHSIGKGCPDLLVGYKKKNFIFEVKDGLKPPSERRLTPDEVKWHEVWQGEVFVIESKEEALRVIGAIK